MSFRVPFEPFSNFLSTLPQVIKKNYFLGSELMILELEDHFMQLLVAECLESASMEILSLPIDGHFLNVLSHFQVAQGQQQIQAGEVKNIT